MTKKRVVITGAGIVSCIGNDLATVEASLRAGKSGIKAVEKFKELGLRSQRSEEHTSELQSQR